MDSFLATSDYLTPAEAVISRARLADEGIESRLERLEIVTWLWHLSLAFRGVGLVVRSADAKRAAEILSDLPSERSEAKTTRQCVECGETLPSDWLVCWRCGVDETAHSDESFFVETTWPSRILSVASGVEYLGVWILLLALLITVAPVFIFPFVLMLFVLSFRNPPQPVNETFAPEEFAASPDETAESDIGIETSRRALASAMFGLVWFPPLTIYSMWILLQSDADGVSAKYRRWRRVAWLTNYFGLLTVMSGLGLLLEVLGEGDFTWGVLWFFDTFFDAARGLGGSRM
jgi:hypothetical protein